MHTRHDFPRLSRRQLFQLAAAGVIGTSASGWIEPISALAAADPKRKRSCILLWMTGGPSQLDTFDLKPGHENGGQFKEIATSVPGLKFSEHLPKLAKQAEHLAIVRSMTTKEGDHGRATALVRSGYLPQGPIRYPTLGSLVAKELGQSDAELPAFVSISPYRAFSPAAFGPGFLGAPYATLLVGDGQFRTADKPDDYQLTVDDLAPPKGVSTDTLGKRLEVLTSLNNRFVSEHGGAPATGYRTAYERAVRLMRSEAGKAFELDGEPAAVRDAYGRNRFGQGCLLARRLVERGVPFVEVSLGGISDNGLGWDTHIDNFDGVRKLSEVLDPAWSTLMTELKDRGLLDSTLIVWMGEFGRTPKINPNGGRDHFPTAWSAALAGGGVRGGQAIGRTSPDGMTVADRPTSVPDFLATVCEALGIDPLGQNISNVGRPIRFVDPSGSAISEALL